MFKQQDTVLNLYENIPIADGLQIAFQTTEEQASYFNVRRLTQVTGLSQTNYLGGKIRIHGEPRSVFAANYLSFNNVAFEGKPFYGKISGVDYVNSSTIDIFFEIDYWQTFMFDAQYRSSYIEREHLSQTAWNQAVANPYRNDIPELMTAEDLPVTDDFEVDYRHPDDVSIREDGKDAQSPINPPDFPDGVFPPEVSPNGTPGLVSTFGGGGYLNKGQGGSGYRNFFIVMQIAEFDGSEAIKSMQQLDFQFTPLTSSNYANAFSRGFFLAVIGDMVGSPIPLPQYHDSTGGVNERLAQNFQDVLNYMAGNNITHQIMGVWVVPREVITHDIHNSTLAYNDPDTFPNEQWIGNPTVSVSVPDYNDMDGYGTIRNPKLRRAPFRYVRAVSPSGEEKSLYLERFASPTAPKVRVYGNFDDVPSLTVAPEQYGGYSLDYRDRLVFDAFPQVGYNIDGFLAHIGAQNTKASLGETATGAEYRKRYGGALDTPSIGSDVLATLGGAFTGDIGAGARSNRETDQINENVQLLNNAQSAQSFDAEQWTSVRRGDAPGGVFEHQRGALIGSGDYVAGNSQGSLGIRLGQSFFSFITVTLRAEILRAYDDYLTCYGYSSKRLGVPRVAAWTKGGGDPHFVNFDGLEFTYCQTRDLKVYGVFDPAAAQIADLFNKGCRFIKGGSNG